LVGWLGGWLVMMFGDVIVSIVSIVSAIFISFQFDDLLKMEQGGEYLK
jgi:hypothetical protein